MTNGKWKMENEKRLHLGIYARVLNRRKIMIDSIGWLATATFASSYFCTNQQRLRWLQAGASTLWMIYGILIGAMPMIVANLIVATLAIASSFKKIEAPNAPNALEA